MKKKGPRREKRGKIPTLQEWAEEERPVEETEKVRQKVKRTHLYRPFFFCPLGGDAVSHIPLYC